MTNQIRDQKPQATNLITFTACGFFIWHLIGFFLARQWHSRNNSCVHGFWIRTVKGRLEATYIVLIARVVCIHLCSSFPRELENAMSFPGTT